MRRILQICFFLPAILLSESILAMGYVPIVNLNYDTAQKLGFDVGVVIGPTENQGLALSVEPGVAGTKYHIGYSGFTYAAVGALQGFRITYTGLHMYRNNGDFVSGRTYTGIDFSYMSLPIILNIGLYKDPVTGARVSMIGFGIGI